MSVRDDQRPCGARKRQPSESQRIASGMLDSLNSLSEDNGPRPGDDEECPRLRPGLFRTAEKEGWARVRVDDHVECHAIQSSDFMEVMARESFLRSGDVPRRSDLRDAARAIEAQARFASDTEEISLRVGGDKTKIFIDLGDDRWTAVVVTADRVRVLGYHPVNFRRPATMLSLPEPDLSHGDFASLRKLHPTLADDESWGLISAWWAGCFRPWGSYASLSLTGESGSGKTSLAKALMSIVDPAVTQLRSPPKNQRDAIAASRNASVLCFDNVSVIERWFSDTLCRLATRVADAERRYFTNSDEHFVKIGAPTLLTSIPEVVSAEDLLDRTLTVNLRQLADRDRVSDADLDRWVQREGPGLFGAMLTALSSGLRRLADVAPSEKIRLLDHLEWALGCAPALGVSEEKMAAAHIANRDRSAVDSVLDSPVGTALEALLDRTPRWEGIARDLLMELETFLSAGERRDQGWPGTPRGLGGALRRLQPSLRRMGILVRFERRGHEHRRVITIERSSTADRPHRPQPSISQNTENGHIEPRGGPGAASGSGRASGAERSTVSS